MAMSKLHCFICKEKVLDDFFVSFIHLVEKGDRMPYQGKFVVIFSIDFTLFWSVRIILLMNSRSLRRSIICLDREDIAHWRPFTTSIG